VGSTGNSYRITSYLFLGVGSRDVEGIWGLAIGFLVFLPDEAAGVSTNFLDFCSGKEMSCVGGFGVFREWGLDGEIVFRSSVFLLVLIVR
jgi:hypothetical protein